MQYMKLGRSGLKVSRLCLGCMTYADPAKASHSWLIPEEDAQPFYQQAFELGINFFDTANVYAGGSSEEVLGRAIRKYGRREDVIITSKVYHQVRKDVNGKGLSRKAIITEAEKSLKRLNTDYIDIYQMHRYDPDTPLDETLRAFDDLVRAGKILYVGASTMFAWQLSKAIQMSRYSGFGHIVLMQNHMNLLYREEEREMMGLCVEEGVAMTPWSPLARGRLTRPWKDMKATSRGAVDGYSQVLYARTMESDEAVVDAVERVAASRGIPMAQVALAWLLQKPGVVSPVIGATRTSQLVDAAAALDVVLTEEEIKELEAPYVAHPLAGF